MIPIWGRYGPYFLHGYTVVLGLGVVLALGATAVLARREANGRSRDWMDGALAGAAGAIVLGRVIFVRLNAAYFAENPHEAWQVQLGGLNYHGALLGGLAGLWLWARLTGRPFARYAGLLAPGLALLATFGWAACWYEGCAYGREAATGWPAAALPDDLGVFASRYQTQLAGVLASLAVFALAWRLSGRAGPGLLFWLTLGGLSVTRAAIALGRGDPAPQVAGMRLDMMIDLALAGAALMASLFIVSGRRSNRKT